jgi:hypothetical protein
LSRSKFARLLSAAFLSAGLTVIPAWSALAVTNPADNPSPITVTGDDGNTYHDGADTLPGYDDEECTYIPGAWFDFANNRVRYADGQSIPWTEWDRASGYNEWLASRNTTPTTNPADNSDSSTETSTTKATTGKGSSKSETTQTGTEPTLVATPLASGTEGTEPIYVAVGQSTSNNPGREVGLLILLVLFGAGVATYLGSALRTRLQQKGSNA